MRYLLLAVFTFLYFSTYAQEPRLIQQFNSDSTLMATGVIANNQRQGLWKFYNPKTNTMLAEGNYANGKREGTWTQFYPNGKRKEITEYRNGKLFGLAQYFDVDGALKKQQIFQDSVLVGKYNEYYGKTGVPIGIDPTQLFIDGQFENGKKTGQWVTFYEYGELAAREFYVNGLQEGPYLEYAPDGSIITEATYVKGQLDGSFKRLMNTLPVETGTYKNGKKVGDWKRYFPGTKILEAEEYYDQNGSKTGEWKYYYQNGRLARIEKYKNNVGTGVWEEYFPNKTLSKRKVYELGVPVGEYVEYHSTGKISVQGQYQSGAKTGIWKSYFPDGELYSIGEYRNDQQTGIWKYFNKIGVLIAEGKFSLGMEDGQWFYYYDGGQLKSVGTYKLGLEDGIWGLFYDNKNLTQEEYWDSGRLMNVSEYSSYDGTKTFDKGTLKDGFGTRITYYVNGQKESEGTYKSGKPDGLWIFYHENGRKASEGTMIDGKKEGPWRYYNSAGRLEDLINFKNDEIVENR
jgi:uncharacterized protein